MFLPGYDEIVGVRDRILDDKQFSDSNRYVQNPFELSNMPVTCVHTCQLLRIFRKLYGFFVPLRALFKIVQLAR